MANLEAEGFKQLKLVNTKFSLNNMHLFDSERKIKKYEAVEQILEEFFHLRLGLYQKRKVGWLNKQSCLHQ
jgi:DNA topoisomerase II